MMMSDFVLMPTAVGGSYATSVFSSKLPGEHAAHVRTAAAVHCRRASVYKVCSVGECGAVTPTS